MVFLESSTLEVKKLDSQKVLSCVWACVDMCAVRMHLCTHIHTLITDGYVGPTATHPQKHEAACLCEPGLLRAVSEPEIR